MRDPSILVAIFVLLCSLNKSAPASTLGGFELDTLFTIAKNPKIKTVDEFISFLPESFRQDFTLIKNSESLQGSSPESPRVLMVDPSRKLIVTFNGDLNARGSEAVEIAFYDSKRERIQFREIEFAADKNAQNSIYHVPLAKNDIEFSDGRVTISKPNPVKCMICHAADPQSVSASHDQRLARYIWHPYRNWPTSYGAEDDYMFINKDQPNDEINADQVGLAQFRDEAPIRTRYRHLKFGPSKNAPFCDYENTEAYMAGEDFDISCRRNSMVTIAIGYNQLGQLAQLTVSKFGERIALSYLNNVFSCGAPTHQENLDFFGREISDLSQIFDKISPLTDPAANMRNVSRVEGQWSFGDESLLLYGVNMRQHFPAAIIRELSKSNSIITKMYATLRRLMYPNQTLIFRDLVKIGYKPEEVERRMSYLIALESDSARPEAEDKIVNSLCRAVTAALK